MAVSTAVEDSTAVVEVAGAGMAEAGPEQQLEVFQQRSGIPVKPWVCSCAPVALALLAALATKPCAQVDEGLA